MFYSLSIGLRFNSNVRRVVSFPTKVADEDARKSKFTSFRVQPSAYIVFSQKSD